MTPWQLRVALKSEMDSSLQKTLGQAWYIAALSRTGKLPKLHTLLNPVSSKTGVDEVAAKALLQAYQTERNKGKR